MDPCSTVAVLYCGLLCWYKAGAPAGVTWLPVLSFDSLTNVFPSESGEALSDPGRDTAHPSDSFIRLLYGTSVALPYFPGS